MHPMVAITSRLSGGFVERGAALVRVIARIAADTRMGPALHDGETVLALLYSRYIGPRRARGYHAAIVVSDRRLYGSIANDRVPQRSYDIPLSYVTNVREDGLAGGSARVFLGALMVDVPVFGREIVPHLRAVMTLHPAARTMGPLIVAPQPGDPIGAHAALSLLAANDVTTRALPSLVFEAARRGALHESAARSLLERTVILDRSLVMGRAMHQGSWLSTLPRPAARAFLCATLGDPQTSSVGPGWELHDFPIERGGTSRGAAAALTAVGLVSAVTLGVGFRVRSNSGLGLDRLRVTLADVPCGTSMQLRAVNEQGERPLPFAATDLLEPLFEAMTRIERRGLLVEVALAGRVPVEQQAAVPGPDLEAAVAALGSPISLRELYREG